MRRISRTTDPDALLARKGGGKEAKLSYCGNVLMENRNGLIADIETLQADGKAERDAAVVMVASIPGDGQVTVGADKGYETKGFVANVRALNATPHVAQKKHSAVDGRMTRHEGYKISRTLLLKSVRARIHSSNERSARLLERAGFKVIEELAHHEIRPGRGIDLVSAHLVRFERHQETWAVPAFAIKAGGGPIGKMTTHLGEEFLAFITGPDL